MAVHSGLHISCALMALTLGTTAQANESAEDQQRSDIIVTGMRDGYVPQDSLAAKVALPLRDIPQSIAVVPAEVLRDQRALSLQDAVRNVPGVTLASGDGQRDEFRIRGFTAIADQFVDGFRDDALYYRDLSNVDRVEVIKGPAAVLYGRGSSGGLVNRVTKKPDGDITAFVLSAGSFDSYRGELDIGRLDQTSHVGFRLTGAIEDNGSFREQQFLKRYALAPSLLIGAGQDTTILIQADYVNDRRIMDLGIPALNGRPVDVPRSTYYGAANARDADFAHSEVVSQRVAVTHRFSNSLSLRNGFNHYRYTLDRQSTIPAAVDPTALTVRLEHSRFDRDEDGWSNQTELTQKLNLLGTAHTILYGFEIAHQSKGSQRFAGQTVAVTSIFDPVLPVVDNESFNTFTDNSVTRLDTRGLYLQDLIDFGHGIKAMLGLRHDWFIQKTDRRLPGQTDLARTDRAWSPRAGLLFQPDAAQSYYVSWSRSFQPSAETFALAANNTDIAPEQTTNREVGAKYTLFGGAPVGAGRRLHPAALGDQGHRSRHPADRTDRHPAHARCRTLCRSRLAGEFSRDRRLFASRHACHGLRDPQPDRQARHAHTAEQCQPVLHQDDRHPLRHRWRGQPCRRPLGRSGQHDYPAVLCDVRCAGLGAGRSCPAPAQRL